MSFEVGRNYERQTDGMTAVVTRTDVTGKTAFLRLKNGEELEVWPVDVPIIWRRYETCPACRGLGQEGKFIEHDRTFGRRQNLKSCLTCQGHGRIYP